MAGVESDGVNDGVNGVQDGGIIGRVGEIHGDAVTPVHPGVGNADITVFLRAGVHHFHAVDGFSAVVGLIPGQHLEQIGIGDFALVGSVGLHGELLPVPVEAQVRIPVVSGLFFEMIRQFDRESAHGAFHPLGQGRREGEDHDHDQQQSRDFFQSQFLLQ